MALNKFMGIGNVGKDPEIRYAGESKVANFNIAITDKWTSKNTGETYEETEWVNLVCWRGAVDIAEKYVKKGAQIYVEGKLKTRQWEDQNGNKRYSTEIHVENLQLLGRKSDGGNNNNPGNGGYQQDGGQSF